MFFKRHATVAGLSPREAAVRPELRIVDVREHKEWRGGHVDGATHVPLDELPARLDELHIAQPIAFICASGARSDMAARLAREAGIDAVNIEGGLEAWRREGLPVDPADKSERR